MKLGMLSPCSKTTLGMVGSSNSVPNTGSRYSLFAVCRICVVKSVGGLVTATVLSREKGHKWLPRAIYLIQVFISGHKRKRISDNFFKQYFLPIQRLIWDDQILAVPTVLGVWEDP